MLGKSLVSLLRVSHTSSPMISLTSFTADIHHPIVEEKAEEALHPITEGIS